MQPTTPSKILEQICAAQQQWGEETRQRAPQPSSSFTTASHIPVEPLSTPLDWPEGLYWSHVGLPGWPPYTRGVQPTMYRGRLWTTRIFSGFGTAQETNRRYKYLLAQGNGGLSVAFDLPALYGYDADHPMAAGEVGKCGVAVSSLVDDVPIEILKIDPEVERGQIARLQDVRRLRDNALLDKKLDNLAKLAQSDDNIMPAILEVVRAYGTLGEISDVLRKI